jgi:hypothetical protein
MRNSFFWQDLLTRPQRGQHIVHVYQDLESLEEMVVFFIEEGVRAGEGALVIATRFHQETLSRRLEKRGVLLEEVLHRGQLVFVDADEALSSFMVRGMPDWDRFHDLIGGVLARVRSRYASVRAYGEMVDILWQGGHLDAANRLEEFWNLLARSKDFSLFCSYFMDSLDKEVYEGHLQSICSTHSHLIPTRDCDRFEWIVNQAGRETLSAPLFKKVHQVGLDGAVSGTRMPPAQASLLWLRQHLPKIADKVLSRARVLKER